MTQRDVLATAAKVAKENASPKVARAADLLATKSPVATKTQVIPQKFESVSGNGDFAADTTGNKGSSGSLVKQYKRDRKHRRSTAVTFSEKERKTVTAAAAADGTGE